MPDYALLSIPVYWLLTFYPHIYSQTLVGRSKNPKAYDNTLARNNDAIQKAMTGPEFAKWQRAKFAHANGNEGLPLFVAAVLAAKHVGMDVNYVAWGVVALRALYNELYINTTEKSTSMARSAAWVGMVGACLTTIVRAALKA